MRKAIKLCDLNAYTNKPITVKSLKDAIKGKVDKLDVGMGLLEVSDQHLEALKAKEGTNYAGGTVNNWKTTTAYLKEFVMEEYKADIPLSQIKPDLRGKFEVWIKKSTKEKRNVKQPIRPCGHNSTLNHIKRLKRLLYYSIENGYLT